MAKLITGRNLGVRLRELAAISERIDVAVAWATPSEALGEILELAEGHGPTNVRILVGVSGYVTHPEALRSIQKSATLRVYGSPEGSLFHTKLYIFHVGSGRICWVGSTNLTRPAFGTNIELVSEAEDVEGQCLSHFEELWTSPLSKASFDIESYQVKWDKNKKRRPSFLKREGGIEAEPVSMSILRKDWPEFLGQLRDHGDINGSLEGSLETIRRGVDLVRRDWRKDLSKQDLQVLKGTGEFTHFGNLRRLNVDRIMGSSQEAVAQRLAIEEALRSVMKPKLLDLEKLSEAFETLDGLTGFGRALATRLLLFARPDSCVVINKKSIRFIAEEFGIEFGGPLSGGQYSGLVKAIQERGWWKSLRPMNEDAGEIWDYRAALIDVFAFGDFNERKQEI